MLQYKELSENKKEEIIEYIQNNSNEKSQDIAKRFNISRVRVEKLQRKYLKKKPSFSI